MIGLDTNILLRLVLRDDDAQHHKVLELFSRLPEIGPGYIGCITLMEFAWYLRKRLKLSRQDVMENISDLLDAEDLVLEDEQVIEEVLGVMAGSDVEFADAFIALKNSQSGCARTVTFDQAAARSVPGMELLT